MIRSGIGVSVAVGIVLSGAIPAVAHPPGKRVLGPSKADPFLREAVRARRAGDKAAESAALLAAKRALAAEGRFSCCVQGGCAECVAERACGCAESLFAKQGVCADCVAGLRGGGSRWPDLDPSLIFLQPMDAMSGVGGPWSMRREGSGTSWMPDSSPMYGWMAPRPIGGWQAMAMGSLSFSVVDGTSRRSASEGAAASNAMWMMRRGDASGATSGWRAMVSFDPWTNGGRGMPLLFQTGETWQGLPLRDRQHPHDALMELSHSASIPLGKEGRLSGMLALVGEPAIGPPAYQHRPSAWDLPIAPIAHHAFEGTHISHGVATVGLVLRDRLRLEGSRFNGAEPDEARRRVDRFRLDSDALRLTWNPGAHWSGQISRGWIGEPAGGGGHAMRRTTGSVQWSAPLGESGHLSAMAAVAREEGHDGGVDAWLLEANWLQGRVSTFGRWETVDKAGLVSGVSGLHPVSKATVGRSWGVGPVSGSETRLGAAVDWHQVPGAYASAYGRDPLSLRLFAMWRPGRMN